MFELKPYMTELDIGIVTDGSRRWAYERGKSFDYGYQVMSEKLGGVVVDFFVERGFKEFSIFCNTIRHTERYYLEVLSFWRRFLEVPGHSKHADKIRVLVKGNREYFINPKIEEAYQALESDTAGNQGFTLNMFLNYSATDDVIRALSKLAKYKDIAKAREADLWANLDLPGGLDILIKTGKRRTHSGFLPVNGDYTAIHFVDKLFPDITEADLEDVLEKYDAEKVDNMPWL